METSENRLNTLMMKIVDSDYASTVELVEGSGSCSVEEILVFLNQIITKWEANELTPAAIAALLKFVYSYLDQPTIQIGYKNRTPIPVGYFSSFLPLCASLLYSFLRIRSFAVTLFPLDRTDKDLKEFVEKMRPTRIIFTISQFLHVEILKRLFPYLHARNLKIFAGGIPFIYDESLKREFSDCIFPRDLKELVLLLENSVKEDS